MAEVLRDADANRPGMPQISGFRQLTSAYPGHRVDFALLPWRGLPVIRESFMFPFLDFQLIDNGLADSTAMTPYPPWNDEGLFF